MAKIMFDILVTEIESESASKDNIPCIGDPQIKNRAASQYMVVGSDPLDCADGPWPEPSATSIAGPEVHWNANNCDLKITKIWLVKAD